MRRPDGRRAGDGGAGRDARDAFRATSWEDPAFEAFFRAATPIEELAGLARLARPAAPARAGERPPDRARHDGHAAGHPVGLRLVAVGPTCPAGSGWAARSRPTGGVTERAGMARLQRAAPHWPFMRLLVQNAEVALARTDPRITARHLGLAGPAGARLAARIADEHARSVRAVLRSPARQPCSMACLPCSAPSSSARPTWILSVSCRWRRWGGCARFAARPRTAPGSSTRAAGGPHDQRHRGWRPGTGSKLGIGSRDRAGDEARLTGAPKAARRRGDWWAGPARGGPWLMGSPGPWSPGRTGHGARATAAATMRA